MLYKNVDMISALNEQHEIESKVAETYQLDEQYCSLELASLAHNEMVVMTEAPVN